MRGMVVLVLAAIALAACEASQPGASGASSGLPAATPSTAATSEVRPPIEGPLLGEWQTEPLSVPPNLVALIEQACRRSTEFPAGVRLMVLDARGDAVAQAMYASDGGAYATCYTVRLHAFGGATAMGGGSSSQGLGPWPQLDDRELRVEVLFWNGDPPVESYVAGRVGAAITRVEIRRPGQPPIHASLSNGWFLTWAPFEWPEGWRIVGMNALGQDVVDVAGDSVS